MNKKIMLCGAIVAALSFSMISCDNDNGGGNGGSSATSVGALHSGTALDNDLPDGYRVSSVGDNDYYYNENGRFIAIATDDYSRQDFEKNTYNLIFTEYGEDIRFTTKVNGKGCITSFDLSIYEDEGDGDYDKEKFSATFSYNGNNQLVSATLKGSSEYVEDGDKERGAFSEKCKLTYSGTKLTKAYVEWEETDEHKDSGTWDINYEYDKNYDNPFFQYTPGQILWLDDLYMEVIEPFFYVGMLGKASSLLPTGETSTDTYTCSESRDTEEYSGSESFGPYRYNSYGALSSADGESYRYTTVSSRGLIAYAPTTASTLTTEFAKMFRHKKHAHHQRIERTK